MNVDKQLADVMFRQLSEVFPEIYDDLFCLLFISHKKSVTAEFRGTVDVS